MVKFCATKIVSVSKFVFGKGSSEMYFKLGPRHCLILSVCDTVFILGCNILLWLAITLYSSLANDYILNGVKKQTKK